MNFLIILYLFLQLAAAFFLYNELKDDLSTLISLGILMLATSVLYLTAHFKNPGYVDFQNLALNSNKHNEIAHTSSQSSIENTKATPHPETSQQQIQKKYCRFCKEDQLIRMKHCYDCKLCVATFDHHCIWLDNCIGEKNRPVFFVYIVVQLVEIMYGFGATIANMIDRGEKETYQIAVLSFLGIAASAVALLVAMHLYLMLTNLTTWQATRWDKIYYLSGRSFRSGSPFSHGVMQNIKDYWSTGFTIQYKLWKFTSNVLETQQKM